MSRASEQREWRAAVAIATDTMGAAFKLIVPLLGWEVAVWTLRRQIEICESSEQWRPEVYAKIAAELDRRKGKTKASRKKATRRKK